MRADYLPLPPAVVVVVVWDDVVDFFIFIGSDVSSTQHTIVLTINVLWLIPSNATVPAAFYDKNISYYFIFLVFLHNV